MKKVILFALWLSVATLAYAITWSRNLDYFPEFPEWVGTTIREMFSSDTPVEDLTIYYLLIVSFGIVLVASMVVVGLFKLIKTGRPLS